MSQRRKSKTRRRHHRAAQQMLRPVRGGWYRIPSEGKFSGICAGLADYYAVSTLLTRGLTITGALFMPQVVIVAYLIGIFVLPTRRQALDKQEAHEHSILDEIERREASNRQRERQFERAFHADDVDQDREDEEHDARVMDTRRVKIRRFKDRMGALDARLQSMERHVTSKRYDLAQEIDQL